MPLPEHGSTWPPKPWDRAQRDMAVWNAWYTGNTTDLETIYTAHGTMRPALGARGIIGRIQRFFWSRPDIQQSAKLHLPAPADLARASADLLFSQPPTWMIAADDTVGDRAAAQKRLDTIFASDETVSTLLEAAEVCSALGGSYLRLWWDTQIADHVMLGTVAADAALPTWRYNRLTAVTFWTTVFDEDGTVLRHLERHEPGRILHGLYHGDRSRLGRRIPLSESPDTQWAVDVVDADGGIATGVSTLTAAYVPNVRPNRLWRTTPGLTQLGRSDFDQLEQWFDALDETYTSWLRDIRLGKARLFVDENLLKPAAPGHGAEWDNEQAVFTTLRAGLGSAADGHGGVQANQFAIRWQEHAQTAAELLNVVLRAAGQSANNFSDNSLTVGVMTATEVNAREKLSEKTRSKKISYWKSALRPLAATAMRIDAAVFGTGITLSDDPELKFPTRSAQSPTEMAATLAALASAHAMSTRQMVLEQHPDWSTEEIDAEVARIANDRAAAAVTDLPSPMDYGAPPGDGDDDIATSATVPADDAAPPLAA
ncbi:phage portal protein [Nocardia transvalensis]|uniref:phage portal protein n=1 Tax=Nocardia transvalensis TaxID=37333 RepID=UPI001894FBDE|nr:phage portal protein [Nocardia transvalensis]MBF6332385.1 phage portal protein [Nocardia transvalensis]